MSLDRRNFLRLTAIGGAAVFGLAACGDKGNGNNASGATRPFTNIQGDVVQVPEKPQRIAALSEPALDALLTMGITPIGAIQGRGQQGVASYLPDEAKDIELFGTVSEVNYEAIGAAAPDLIVADGTSINNRPDIVELLSQIAPVAYTGWAGGPWRDNLRNLGEAINEAGKAEDVITSIEQRMTDLAEPLKKFADKTFSVVRWQGNSASLILKELPSGTVLQDLGLRRPPSQDHEGPGHSVPVSAENLAEIDADYIFFGTLGGSSVGNPQAGGNADVSGAEKAFEQAKTVSGFTDLKAVKDENVLLVDGAAWTSTGGPALIERLLDDIERLLLTDTSH